MAKRDYYEVLGLDKTADEKKLKSAYRKLAKKYHPDSNPGDRDAEIKFKEVGEAYAVLSDPEKRKLYDTYGFAAFEGPDPTQQGGTSGWQYTGNGSHFQSFHFTEQDAEDLFSSMFGDIFGHGHRGFGRASAGGFGDGGMFSDHFRTPENLNLQTSLTISFMEAALGCRKTIRLEGSDGVQTLEINIPAGIDEGKSIRLKGKGQISRSGKAGDLLIKIHIEPDQIYTRDGYDIYTKAWIPFTTAALGGEAIFPTIHGNVSCRVPAGTQDGKKIRLKGKGIKTAAFSGDEYVEIRIEVPRNLTETERDILREFEMNQRKKAMRHAS